MDQVQIYVNLLKLLDYQLKELLKIHMDTYVTLNTAIYVHNMQNTYKIEEVKKIYETKNPEFVNIIQEPDNELQNLLFNDVDSESENEKIDEIIYEIGIKEPQDNENIDDPLITPVKQITLNPYIESSFNGASCFITKPACIPSMYKILPSSKKQRDKQNKKDKTKKKNKEHNENGEKNKAYKCNIM